MSNSEFIEQMKHTILTGLRIEDPDADVIVQRTSLGWVDLHIVSDRFKNLDHIDRELYIDVLLTSLSMNLGSYPIRRYDLLTREEANKQVNPPAIQLPLWSEILMAPEPVHPLSTNESEPRKPLVATFYSFKGGVGRTTALGFTARGLVKEGYRVVVIDFDLEAPGLSFLFPGGTGGNLGLLDYLHQRYLTPDMTIPDIRDCLQLIPMNTSGELYIVPAGEYNESFIHRLADLDVSLFYRREQNPLHQLFDDIQKEIDPDVIIIDARTGFNAMSAVALFDRADLAMICFSATDQSFAGLELIAQAIQRHRAYRGTPDLRFVITPVPSTQVLPEWQTRTYDWIGSHELVSDDFTLSEVCYAIPYSQSIPTLTTLLSDDIELALAAPYRPLVESIRSYLPTPTTVPAEIPVENEQNILQQLHFDAATAQELSSDTISQIFQRTSDFPKFLGDRIWLVLGAKGTGKTLLFRLFVDESETARKLARDERQNGQSALTDTILFLVGHGRYSEKRPALLESTDFESFERATSIEAWPQFWRSYAVLQLCRGLSEAQHDISFIDTHTPDGQLLIKLAQETHPSRRAILEWLISRARDPLMAAQTNDDLASIDRHLVSKNMKVWLLYDELDAGFSKDNQRRRRALDALCAWWIERGTGMRAITPKILLREDIWNTLDFVNKAHYATRLLKLTWQEEDLWRLVLRQILKSSPLFTSQLKEQYGITNERLNNLGIEELRRSLHPLWGQYLGRKGKAYTHNWVRTRISDSKGISFPRSLILLLKEAVNQEKRATDENTYKWLLRPRSLTSSMDFVSQRRVEEVKNEYPEFSPYLDQLDGERSPIARSRLAEVWSNGGAKLSDPQLSDLITGMSDAGILQEYNRNPEIDEPRYTVAELYLYGLNMKRYGQR